MWDISSSEQFEESFDPSQCRPLWLGSDGLMRYAIEIPSTSTKSVAVVLAVDIAQRRIVLRNVVVIDAPDWPGFGLDLLDDV